jgi:lipoprotein NlpD
MSSSIRTASRLVSIAFVAIALTACSSTPRKPAPIVDRTASAPGNPAASRAPVDPAAPTYVVKRGDTLRSIALDHGRDARDLAAWNQLSNPDSISVGQTLRLSPPGAGGGVASASGASGDAPGVETHAITSSGRVDSRSLESAPLPPPAALPPASGITTAPAAPAAVPVAPATPLAPAAAPAAPAAAPAAPAPPQTAPHASADGITWAWPGSGAIVDRFDNNRNKGLDLAGKVGDPVRAASGGTVVYAGSGLRGYGSLVIIKHSNSFLSAYAHNSKLLVKEKDEVKLGQQIAEVGSSDADRPKLHFEIRKDGTPVDPLQYLPQR